MYDVQTGLEYDFTGNLRKCNLDKTKLFYEKLQEEMLVAKNFCFPLILFHHEQFYSRKTDAKKKTCSILKSIVITLGPLESLLHGSSSLN